MNRLEEKMKRSSGAIAVVLMIAGVSLMIGICLSLAFVVVALILFAVAVVFDYGAQLQRQSDETL